MLPRVNKSNCRGEIELHVRVILKFKYYGIPSNVKKIQTGDILRIPQVGLDCRYPEYHKFSTRSDFADMLEVSAI